jgi:hypothetical protein
VAFTAPDQSGVTTALTDYAAQWQSLLDASAAVIAADEQKIADLEAQVAALTPPPPPPPAPTTLFGGTPRGLSNWAGVASMDETYGPASVVRLFWPGTGGANPATDRKVVGSCKSLTNVAAWAKTMWRWAYQHEIDSKVKKGLVTLPAWKADMERLVALNIPGLSVILTADCFVNPSKNPANYLISGVTHLGVDFDGISSSTGYHDYSKELAEVEAFVKANGLTWGVAEFGANRANNDGDGSVRAAWLKTWGDKFAVAGAEYVCLWESYGQTGSTFTAPAEISTIRTYFTS